MFPKKNSIKNINRQRPDNKKKGYLYLNRNERTVDLTLEIKKKLQKELIKVNLGTYPEISKLYNNLSKLNSISKDNLFVTEGVTGGIKLILDSMNKTKKNVIFPYPTFSLYEIFIQLNEFKSIKILYSKNYILNINKLLSSINKSTAAVFLPNPNVPIEGYLDQKIIIKIANKCLANKCVLVIDEVYFHFGSKSASNLINKFKNIIILRSLSKGFGLPGLRVGYMISHRSNIEYLSKNRIGYETNSLSIAASNIFLNDTKFLKSYTKQVKQSLILIKEKMQKINVKTVGGSYGNYIFIDFKDIKKCKKIVNELYKEKIVVRDNWPKPFETGILISGTSIKNTKFFIKTLYKIINHKNYVF
tara:strand:+ start:12389 stop:13468 length:1080 start_codon:yes stop_codon:yes gene_type:complete